MPWHHVVTAWDGSPASSAAATCAENIAGQLGCRYTVLVTGDGDRPIAFPLRQVNMTGVPSIEVPRWAERHGGDVIVLPGGTDHYAASSAIIRRSSIPCLLVPCQQRGFTRVHVALDRTERGLQVLGPSKTAAESLNAGIDYVTVAGAGDEDVTKAWLRKRTGAPAADVMVLSGAAVSALTALMARSPEAVLALGVRQGLSGSVPESSGVGRSLLRTAQCAFLTIPL